MEIWERVVTVAIVIAVSLVLAKLVDMRMARRDWRRVMSLPCGTRLAGWALVHRLG